VGWASLKITVDTNVLVRSVVRDDVAQARAADKVLKQASVIAVAMPTLCEFVWVLRKVYGFGSEDIASALRALLAIGNVALNRSAAEAGIALLEIDGDFADAVIAYEGRWLGGDCFVSFDKTAVSLLARQGHASKLLGKTD
jgi:predicted nucleic-acid-binding protein